MKRRYANGEEERLAAELRGEAERGGPGYSAMLHERIMRGVREEWGTAGAGEACPRQPMKAMRRLEGVGGWRGHGTRWRWVGGVVATAAALVVVGLWMWGRGIGEKRDETPKQVVERKEGRGVPAVDVIFWGTAASAFARLDAKLDEGKLAYLDDDAKQLARFVLDRTSVLPVGK